jgi:glutamate/tyrosine decarboxylase-like PLP-dependent enzyme
MMTGIGLEAVRTVPVDEYQRMQSSELEELIQKDIRDGYQPFMVVTTAGTTGTGAVDPIAGIAVLAEKHSLWLHTDAAWGGAAMLDPDTRHVLSGIERSDSLTFDMHKWMSVPMGTSIFLTTDKEILFKTFRITAEYMPKEADNLGVTDPYIHSIQWSRRFIGLRTYLSLLIFGWEGHAQTIRHQVETGNYLKQKLADNNWTVLNNTSLPVACFTDLSEKYPQEFANKLCDDVLKSGKAWISVYPVNGVPCLRACITNYATTQKEIDDLISLLNDLRNNYQAAVHDQNIDDTRA